MHMHLGLLATVLCGFSYIQSMNTTEILEVVIQEKQNISPQKQFFNAARTGDVDSIQQLLTNYPDTVDINAIDTTTGYTAFIEAARYKHIPVMELLLNHGYNLKISDKNGMSGYHWLFAFDEFVSYVQQLSNFEKLIQHLGKGLLDIACAAGALEQVKLLVHCGVNPQEVLDDQEGMALHTAIKFNHFAIVQYLVEECRVNPSVLSILHIAAANGNRKIFDYLALRVPNDHVYSSDKEFGTVVHNAIAGNKPDMVKYLVAKYPELLTMRSIKNISPLALAVVLNREDIVRFFIEECNLTILEDNYNDIPLFSSVVERGYFNLVKYFAEEVQLDPLQEWEIGGRKWPSAFHEAASSGRLNILKYFIEERGINQESKEVTTDKTILDIAVSSGYYPEILDYLINQRAFNVNVPASTNGKTPLYYAAAHGILPCVKELIEKYKASVDQPTNTLVTPLMAAVFFNRLPVVRYLLEVAKANSQLQDKDGSTIVHFASRHMSILNYLLSEHYPAIDINAVYKNGDTVIHYLVSTNGTIVALRKLLQAGANSRLPNNNDVLPRDYTTDTTVRDILNKFGKYTPRLFQAYDKKSRVELQYLAPKITFNIQDEHGDTLLHKAIRDNNAEMMKFLLTINREAAGVKNKQGETPVTMAYFNYRPMFELLWNAVYGKKSIFYRGIE